MEDTSILNKGESILDEGSALRATRAKFRRPIEKGKAFDKTLDMGFTFMRYLKKHKSIYLNYADECWGTARKYMSEKDIEPPTTATLSVGQILLGNPLLSEDGRKVILLREVNEDNVEGILLNDAEESTVSLSTLIPDKTGLKVGLRTGGSMFGALNLVHNDPKVDPKSPALLKNVFCTTLSSKDYAAVASNEDSSYQAYYGTYVWNTSELLEDCECHVWSVLTLNEDTEILLNDDKEKIYDALLRRQKGRMAKLWTVVPKDCTEALLDANFFDPHNEYDEL